MPSALGRADKTATRTSVLKPDFVRQRFCFILPLHQTCGAGGLLADPQAIRRL